MVRRVKGLVFIYCPQFSKIKLPIELGSIKCSMYNMLQNIVCRLKNGITPVIVKIPKIRPKTIKIR